jgi:hypothetical protein
MILRGLDALVLVTRQSPWGGTNGFASFPVPSPENCFMSPIPAPTILFLGLARNCASTLPAFFAFLEELHQAGFSCSAIIGENGSSDCTRRLIEQAAGLGVSLMDTSFMQSESSRLRRMAIGRQFLLDQVHARAICGQFICVADLDNAVANPPSVQMVYAAIGILDNDPSLFAVGATSKPVYYDLYSLRATGFEFLSDLPARLERAKKQVFTYHSFMRRDVYPVERAVTALIPLRCDSSFNGICFYRAADYVLGSYRCPREAMECEHVTFNLSIAKACGKQMLISSDLILRAPRKHIPASFVAFWATRICSQLSVFGSKV